MGLTRKLTLQSVSTDGRTITIRDTTGAYNLDTNPTGYGTPNPATTFFAFVAIKAVYLNGSLSWLFTTDAPDFLSGSNYSITSALLPTPGDYPFIDGVLYLTSYAASTPETVTGTIGDTQITGSLTDFVGADSIIDTANNVYIIDTTQANDSSTIYLTTPLIATITQARASYSAGCYVMVNAEFVCKLTSAVGSMAQTCNEDGWSAPLGDLLVKKFAADFEFASADYNGAQQSITSAINKLNSLLNG